MILALTLSAPFSIASAATAGSSAEAEYVSERFEEGRHCLQASNSLGSGVPGAFGELLNVAKMCSAANWDGHGARAVHPETVKLAWCFLESLPLGTSAPSIGAEPDGHVTLEWYRSLRRLLSVSISPQAELHYAALLGPGKAYGTEPFFGETPQAVLDLIHRVIA